MDITKHKLNILLQFILPFYLLLIFITTIVASYGHYLTHNRFTIGDWLINYQGGFVRRGLIGEIVYQMAVHTNGDPGILVIITQIFLYLIFLIFSYLLLINQKSLLPYIFLIFSPFIFSFQVNDIWGGFRKEIVFLAFFSITIWIASTQTNRNIEKILKIIIITYPLLILTHEQLAVFLPYILIIHIYKTTLSKKNVLTILLLILPSIITFIFCYYYSGTPDHVKAINKSLIDTGYTVETGAISWIGKSISDYTKAVNSNISSGYYFIYYPLILIISAIAYIPILGKLSEIFKNNYVRLLLFTSLTGTVMLMFVSADWGRIIYIHLVSIFLISFLVEKESSIKSNVDINLSKTLTHKKKAANTYLVTLLLIIYSLTWYIPHYLPHWYYIYAPNTTIQRFIFPYWRISGD